MKLLLLKAAACRYRTISIYNHDDSPDKSGGSRSRIYKTRRGDSDLAQGGAKRNPGINKRSLKYIRTLEGWKLNTTKGEQNENYGL